MCRQDQKEGSVRKAVPLLVQVTIALFIYHGFVPAHTSGRRAVHASTRSNLESTTCSTNDHRTHSLVSLIISAKKVSQPSLWILSFLVAIAPRSSNVGQSAENYHLLAGHAGKVNMARSIHRCDLVVPEESPKKMVSFAA